MKVPLDLFQTFIAFAESKNIFEASDLLGISQPSVSVQLKKIEDFFGTPLFTADGKKKVLNHHGKVLYGAISSQLSDLESSILNTKRTFQTLDKLTLKIACRRELFQKVLTMNIFPGSIKLISSNSQSAVKLLEENKVDFAISTNRPDSLEIIARELFSVGAHFLVPKSFLKGKKHLQSLRDLEFLNMNYFIAYSE